MGVRRFASLLELLKVLLLVSLEVYVAVRLNCLLGLALGLLAKVHATECGVLLGVTRVVVVEEVEVDLAVLQGNRLH